MKAGLTISTVGHLTLLAWGLVAFSSKPFDAAEAVPVDVISDTEFSQIMAGSKTAPKAEAPKPVVDKIAEPKPVKDPTPKVSDKPEITTAAAENAPPPMPEAKPEKREKTEPETKPDLIADAIKRDEAKKPEPPKKAETPLPPKKPPPPQPRFDANKIAALLDKRDPRRESMTGATLNHTAALGAPTATGPTLSMSELDALRARLHQCWDVPVGVQDARSLSVIVHFQLNKDGSLASDPRVLNHSQHPVFQVAAESAVRAVRKCAPFSFLPVAKYEAWRDLEANFDPREMFGG